MPKEERVLLEESSELVKVWRLDYMESKTYHGSLDPSPAPGTS